MLGNYNSHGYEENLSIIIPLREMLGNYNGLQIGLQNSKIIPLREMLGNYNRQRFRAIW